MLNWRTLNSQSDGTVSLTILIAECLILTYIHVAKDLLMVQAVANLPDQCDIYARQFAKYAEDGIFDDGIFGPTKEEADIYRQVPSHSGMCSLKDFGQQDLLTTLVIRNLDSVNKVLKYLAGRVSRKSTQKPSVTSQQYIAFDTVLRIMDLIAGLYAPMLLMGCMGVLSCIKSEKARIGVLGVFGILLTVSLVLFVPTLRRCDIFAITAAFFAVGGVYIGAKSVGN